MASEIIGDVGPAKTYATITAFLAAQAIIGQNLVSRDVFLTIECYGEIDDNPTINGWTTDATRYIKITVPSAERHNGTWSATKARIVPTADGDVITISDDYVSVEWLQIYPLGSAVGSIAIYTNNSNTTIDHCIIDGHGSAYTVGIEATSCPNSRIFRNIIFDCRLEWEGGIYHDGGAVTISQNTIYGCSGSNVFGIRSRTDLAVTAIGNAVFSCGTAFGNDGDWVAASGFNCTDAASAPGANNQVTKTDTDQFISVTAGSEDFHVKDISADLYGNSYNGQGSPYNIDIDGDTATRWDIGADEGVFGSASTSGSSSPSTSPSSSPSVSSSPSSSASGTASASASTSASSSPSGSASASPSGSDLNIGYEIKGSNSWSFGLFLYCNKIVLPEDSTLESITAYINNSGGGSRNYMAAIYGHDAINDLPQALIVSSGSQAVASAYDDWKTTAITPQFLTAGTYWIVIFSESSDVFFYYDTGLSASLRTSQNQEATFALPDPYTDAPDDQDNGKQWSIYATYAVSVSASPSSTPSASPSASSTPSSSPSASPSASTSPSSSPSLSTSSSPSLSTSASPSASSSPSASVAPVGYYIDQSDNMTLEPFVESTQPAKDGTLVDGTFFVNIIRITDCVADGIGDDMAIPVYSRFTPANSNKTKLFLERAAGGEDGLIYNAESPHELISALPRDTEIDGVFGHFVSMEGAEFRWDKTGSYPNRMYYVGYLTAYDMRFFQYETDTEVATTLHNFAIDFPTGSYINNDVEGDCSDDSRYWAWMVFGPYTYRPASNSWFFPCIAIITYDKTTDTILGTLDRAKYVAMGGTWTSADYPSAIPRPNMVDISPNGDRVVLLNGMAYVGNRDGDIDGYFDGTFAFDLDFTNPTKVAVDQGHSGWAWDLEGNQLFVSQNNRNDWIEATDINGAGMWRDPADANRWRGDLQIVFYTEISSYSNPSNFHFGRMPASHPGWSLLYSTSDYPNTDPGDNQIMMLEMVDRATRPARIWRLGHTHNRFNSYYAEGWAAISQDGQTVYWSAKWTQPTDYGYIETYKIDLPATWVTDLNGTGSGSVSGSPSLSASSSPSLSASSSPSSSPSASPSASSSPSSTPSTSPSASPSVSGSPSTSASSSPSASTSPSTSASPSVSPSASPSVSSTPSASPSTSSTPSASPSASASVSGSPSLSSSPSVSSSPSSTASASPSVSVSSSPSASASASASIPAEEDSLITHYTNLLIIQYRDGL